MFPANHEKNLNESTLRADFLNNKWYLRQIFVDELVCLELFDGTQKGTGYSRNLSCTELAQFTYWSLEKRIINEAGILIFSEIQQHHTKAISPQHDSVVYKKKRIEVLNK